MHSDKDINIDTSFELTTIKKYLIDNETKIEEISKNIETLNNDYLSIQNNLSEIDGIYQKIYELTKKINKMENTKNILTDQEYSNEMLNGETKNNELNLMMQNLQHNFLTENKLTKTQIESLFVSLKILTNEIDKIKKTETFNTGGLSFDKLDEINKKIINIENIQKQFNITSHNIIVSEKNLNNSISDNKKIIDQLSEKINSLISEYQNNNKDNYGALKNEYYMLIEKIDKIDKMYLEISEKINNVSNNFIDKSNNNKLVDLNDQFDIEINQNNNLADKISILENNFSELEKKIQNELLNNNNNNIEKELGNLKDIINTTVKSNDDHISITNNITDLNNEIISLKFEIDSLKNNNFKFNFDFCLIV